MKTLSKQYNLLIVLVVMICGAASLHAEMYVRKFVMLDTDIDANVIAPVRDHNSGKYCAIVKVVTTQSGFSFSIGNMGSPEKVDYKQGMGEIWLYLPVGCKKLRISHPKFGQLETDSDDGFFWFPQGGLQEARCYRLVLNTGAVSADDNQPRVTTGWLVLDSEPSGADVYIGAGTDTPEYVGTTPFQKKYPYGNYNYSIRKNLYHNYVGIFELNQAKIQETMALKPAFGRVSITSTPSDARVEIDGVDGSLTTPCTSGNLKSGKYTVRLTRDKYSPEVRQVTIADGETAQLSVPLAANFAAVTINSLDGAEISINGKTVGRGSVTQELGEGVYDVQVVKAHHRSASRQIEVFANKPQTIAINPSPIYGSLDVMTTPIGARVVIGGKDYGESPLSIDRILEGDYDVVLSKAGCATVTQRVTIVEGKTADVSSTLPQGRAIKITCAQTGARIFVDGKDMGMAPFVGSLSFGTHQVYATADGKKTLVKTIDVTNGVGEMSPIALSFFGNRIFTVKGVTFTMVAVDGGTFTMGATAEMKYSYDKEKPTHQVTLSSYLIGETEVTQALWKAVMGRNPSKFKGDDRPVERVSWLDCQEFIKRLNELTGEIFRLPTEAEWEFAARGGNKSRGYNKYSGNDKDITVAWLLGNSGGKTHDVATKLANELGIYDMSGNVIEWCNDWYGNYSSNSQINPTGPTSGKGRVGRGGGCFCEAMFCRTSYRQSYASVYSSYDFGLRLAL